MADSTVSALTTATAPSAADLLLLIQGGTSKKTTVADVRLPITYSAVAVNDWFIQGMIAGANIIVAGGTWRGAPLLLPLGYSWDRIYLLRNTAGTAGCTSRVVIFNDNGSGRPGTVALDSANFASDTTSAITLTESFTPTTLTVWAGIVTNGSPATPPQFQARTTTNEYALPAGDSTGPQSFFSGTGYLWGIAMAGAAGNNPTMTYPGIGNAPRFGFRRSA